MLLHVLLAAKVVLAARITSMTSISKMKCFVESARYSNVLGMDSFACVVASKGRSCFKDYEDDEYD